MSGKGWLCMVLVVLLAGCAPAQVAPTGTPLPTEPPPPTATMAPPPTPTVVPTPTAAPVPDIPEPERPLLMAHYMPWYQTPYVTGYWGWHWTMEHFNPFRTDDEGRPSIASYYLPLTGPYDSSDPALLEYQVLLMHLSGIDGVIVDWYGIEPFWDYGVLNQATNDLFPWIQKAGLRFAICYEDQSIKHMADNKHLPLNDVQAHGQAVMAYMQETWFGDPAYLKVVDRPVLFTFGPQYFKSAADWDGLFAGLDVEPALITLDGHTEAAGLASYPWPPMWLGKGGVLDQEALENYLAGFYAKAARRDYVVGGAWPGFQDIYQEAGIAEEARYLDPRDGETFRATLQMALDQHPDVIQLVTWNDYGESTGIEPTVEFGYQYLEMVQEARRATDPGFSFAAADLALPLRLFELRGQFQGDAETNARLDEVFAAIVAGDADAARAILEAYPVEP